MKSDWIREVTEASNSCVVLVHLYENSIVECEVLDEAMRVLAPKFKYLKFLRIKSTHAIENWPEKNLPALFIYEDGAMKTQLITLKALDGKATKSDGIYIYNMVHIVLVFDIQLFLTVICNCCTDLEWYLYEKGIVKESELEDDPKLSRTNVKKSALSAATVFRVSGMDSDED